MSQIIENSELESESDEESDYSSSNSAAKKMGTKEKKLMNSHDMCQPSGIQAKDNDTLLKESFNNRIRQLKQGYYIQMNQNFKKRSKSIEEPQPLFLNQLQRMFLNK